MLPKSVVSFDLAASKLQFSDCPFRTAERGPMEGRNRTHTRYRIRAAFEIPPQSGSHRILPLWSANDDQRMP